MPSRARIATLLAAAAAPIVGALLGTLFAISLATGSVAACAQPFNMADADADNAWMGTAADTATELVNLGLGQSTTLAFPWWTNSAYVNADTYKSASSCNTYESRANTTTWYAVDSRTATAIAGFAAGATSGSGSATTAWSHVQVGGDFMFSTSFDNSPELYGLDLSVGGRSSVPAGSVTHYLDHIRCNDLDPEAPWSGDNYVHRLSGAPTNQNNAWGAFGWLYLGVTNAYSESDAGAGGGGAGDPANANYMNFSANPKLGTSGCVAIVAGPTSDTISYDATSPVPTINIAAGAVATSNNLVSLTIGGTETNPWLMAFSNNSTCNGNATFTDWKAYATSFASWDLADYAYDYTGSSVASVCVRVMDRGGNIGYARDTIVYDTVGPEVAAFSATAASKSTTVAYTLTFDESATGLTTTDLTNQGTASCGTPTITGSGTSYTVTYSCPGAPEGSTVWPLLRANGVSDAYTNTGPSAGEYGTEVTFDRTPPAVTSFRLTQTAVFDTGVSATDGITNAATLQFTLVFNETVTDLTAVDFTHNLTSCTVGNPSSAGRGTTYTIDLTGNPTGCAEGALTLTLAALSVTDAANNAGPASPATATATIDRTGPTGCVLSIAAGAAYTGVASNTLSLSGCVGATLGVDSMRFSNNASTYSAYETYATSKAAWDLTATATGGTAVEGTKTVSAQISDSAGNASTTNDTIIYDLIAPVVSFTSPAAGTCGTISNPCTNLAAYPLTYSISDGVGSGISLTQPPLLSRYRASASPAGCPASGYVADSSEYITPNSTTFLSAGLVDGRCYYWQIRSWDAAGNTATATSVRLLVDRTAPAVSSFILGDGSGVTTNPLLTGSVSATDSLTGMGYARWSLTNGSGFVVACNQSGLSYATNRAPAAFSLTAGSGDYAVTAEVCDHAGNTTTMRGVVRLNSLKKMPVLTMGAEIRDCSTSSLLSTNTSGVIYWPVGKQLCFYPKPQQTATGTDTTNGRNWVGRLDTTATSSYQILSDNPCVNQCAGLIGSYPSKGIYTYLPDIVGQALVTASGQSTWTVPVGVSSISAVAIGGGGGGRDSGNGGAGGAGGALAYGTIVVTSGETLYLTIGTGGQSGSTSGSSGGVTAIRRGSHGGTNLLVAAGGGGAASAGSTATSSTGGSGSINNCVPGTTCFAGGSGGNASSSSSTGGGGGAGGYSGAGGNGGLNGAAGASSTGGGGGGGGGGSSSNGSGGGGGVGLLGAGGNGSGGGGGVLGTGGGGGSGGTKGGNGTNSGGGPGGTYGGGGGGADDTVGSGNGMQGAIRIIYGTGRAYPSTGIADASGSGVVPMMQLRLDRETSNAASSLPAVSLLVRVTVTVNWYLATCSSNCAVQATSTYSIDLELRVRSLGVGQRPG
jgi:hypothetical protein